MISNHNPLCQTGTQFLEISLLTYNYFYTLHIGTKEPVDDEDGSLATVHTTLQGTAILEAGRLGSNSDGRRPMSVLYKQDVSLEPKSIATHEFA